MAKVALFVLVFLHGAIHLMGFYKSLNPTSLPGLELGVTKAWGIVFLLAAVALTAAGLLGIGGSRAFWLVLSVALFISQTAIFAHFSDAKYGTLANVILLLVALSAFGEQRFAERTRLLVEDLSAERRMDLATDAPISPPPPPVARYLENVLPPGARPIEGVIIEQRGEFNSSLTQPKWSPFEATHHATIRPPGFVWAAEVRFFPGVSVFVHDSLLSGRGRVAPWVSGLIPLSEAADRGGDVTRGELLRFLAESPWYPTLLMGHPGLTWEPIDDRRAVARLTSGTVTAALEMSFDEEDRLVMVRSRDRPRLENGITVKTPWVGRWFDYERHDGILVPTRGEVAWEIDGREIPYWRGTLTSIHFDD